MESVVADRVKKPRKRFKQTQPLEDRLAADTAALREKLRSLPPNSTDRARVMRRIKQNDAAIALTELLKPPN